MGFSFYRRSKTMNHQQHLFEALELICCKFDSLEDVDLTHLIDDQSHLLAGGLSNEAFEKTYS
jgi:hypothetical protein